MEGKIALTKNQFSRNKKRCAVAIYLHMHHICAKGFVDSNFNLGVIDRI